MDSVERSPVMRDLRAAERNANYFEPDHCGANLLRWFTGVMMLLIGCGGHHGFKR